MLQHIGREQLYTHQPEITSDNVLDVISKAMTKFRQNADDCQFLLNYEKGDQLYHCFRVYDRSLFMAMEYRQCRHGKDSPECLVLYHGIDGYY